MRIMILIVEASIMVTGNLWLFYSIYWCIFPKNHFYWWYLHCQNDHGNLERYSSRLSL